MGSPGRTPILQVGGVQEAKTVAPPKLLRAVAPLLPEVLVVLQVRGGLDRATPVYWYNVSTAVAVMGTLPPLFTVIEFPAAPWPPIWRRMDWIKQVVYG